MLFNIDTKKFLWGPGSENIGADFLILSSEPELLDHYDFLIFTDSKGMTLKQDEVSSTWTHMLATERTEAGFTVLLVTRPKVITVFFTLVNFVRNNSVKFDFLITNLGFVDHTPKKKEFLEDLVHQLPDSFPLNELSLKDLGTYKLSSGKEELLFSYNYSTIPELIGYELNRSFRFCVLIGIIEFNSKIKIDRVRPEYFFEQLRTSNEFIFNITKKSPSMIFFQYLRAPLSYPEKISYDAVHFTSFGHKQLFQNIKVLLSNYNI